jgi:triacylglycerol lipase
VRRLSLLVLLAGGCAMREPARCDRLAARVEECTGVTTLPVECDSLTATDVDNLTAALEALPCESVAALLPLDGDPRAASCRIAGEACAAPILEPPRFAPTRYPIALVNGIDLSAAFSWSDRIVSVLRDEGGHDARLAVVPPYEAPPARARVLWEAVQSIRRETGAARVNLICHSLGGLDCRYLVSPAGLAADLGIDPAETAGAIASITTVATAHRGTPIADIALGFVPGADAGDALERLAAVFGAWLAPDALEQSPHLRAAIAALSESNAIAFNAAITDAPGVFVQSWAGFSREAPGDPAAACGDDLALLAGEVDQIALPLLPAQELIAARAGASDGLCPIDSARWGLFRGCVPADHMEQLGRGNLPDINVRTGVDIAWFYAAVAADLAARGF